MPEAARSQARCSLIRCCEEKYRFVCRPTHRRFSYPRSQHQHRPQLLCGSGHQESAGACCCGRGCARACCDKVHRIWDSLQIGEMQSRSLILQGNLHQTFLQRCWFVTRLMIAAVSSRMLSASELRRGWRSCKSSLEGRGS